MNEHRRIELEEIKNEGWSKTVASKAAPTLWD
jgi:hypothetical protein